MPIPSPPDLTAPAAPDPGDDAARRALRRHRGFATGLLVGMAGLTLGTYWMPPGIPTEVLQAAAKAGFVGGIADWFAVTALFRHPLGLPIPHTAIIPAQKARLGRALGRFVANHVFTGAEVSRVLAGVNLPGIIQRFLSDPAATRPAAQAIAGLMPRLLATVEDGRARRILARIVPRILGGPGAGRIVGRALRGLLEGGRHQEVFGFILSQLKGVLAEKEESLQRAIEERVREQGGRLVGWAVGASVARRVIGQINAELAKMDRDGSDLRGAFDEWMRREIGRIEEDPVRAAEIGHALGRVLMHESVQAWVWDVWSRARLALEQDATRPNGRTVALIEGALANLGNLLETDQGVRDRLQRAAEGVVASILPAGQGQISDFIANVVASWDAATITDRLELRVGKDLQYVRINGTLVGFLVGGLVYGVLRATFGHVSF
jgi:uncharacterized membrane-anchored protein YjiN (DUF445 family)